MDRALKQRLVGAIVLVACGVIFIPALLQRGSDDSRLTIEMEIPPQPAIHTRDRLASPPVSKQYPPLAPIDKAVSEAKQRSSQAAAKTPAAIKPKPVSDKAPEAKPAKPIASKPAPPPPTAAKRPAPAAVKAATEWIVQIGSFSQETNAVVLRDKLRKAGFKTAFVESASTAAGMVYRVRLGPLSQRELAEKKVKQLKSAGYARGIVMALPKN